MGEFNQRLMAIAARARHEQSLQSLEQSKHELVDILAEAVAELDH